MLSETLLSYSETAEGCKAQNEGLLHTFMKLCDIHQLFVQEVGHELVKKIKELAVSVYIGNKSLVEDWILHTCCGPDVTRLNEVTE